MSTDDLTKQALADAITDGAIGCRNCGDTWERPVSSNGTVGPCEDCGDPEYSLVAPPSTSEAIRAAAEALAPYLDPYFRLNQDWQDRKEQCDELHLRKIDLADEVFVLNIDGYIGESTAREIAYAESTGKPVKYLDAAALRASVGEEGK